MRVPLLFSVTFHVAIFLFAIFGLPTRDADVVEDYRVIDVEVVSETQTPEPQPIPKEKQEARKEPEPPPPPPKLAPPPPPPPPPAPPEQIATLPPEPKPEPKPEPVPEPVPIPELKPKPAEAPPKPKPVEEPPKAKVEQKPKPTKQAPRPKPRPRPDLNTMMLKTMQKLKETPPKQEQKEKEKETEKKSFDDKMAALMQRKDLTPQEEAQRAPLGESLSVSEIDAIRRQIERCWLVPAAIGAKDAGTMKVDIELTLNPDGSLRAARIVDQFRAETNATYKAVAESALRAVRNPRCNKFNLPLEKYEIWKDMIVGFDPSEMVGR